MRLPLVFFGEGENVWRRVIDFVSIRSRQADVVIRGAFAEACLVGHITSTWRQSILPSEAPGRDREYARGRAEASGWGC